MQSKCKSEEEEGAAGETCDQEKNERQKCQKLIFTFFFLTRVKGEE